MAKKTQILIKKLKINISLYLSIKSNGTDRSVNSDITITNQKKNKRMIYKPAITTSKCYSGKLQTA